MANHLRRTATGWVADFRINGKRKQLAARTKTEARERMAKAIADSEQQAPSSGYTLKEARLLSLRVRWAGLACEATAAGYSADVVEFYGESYLVSNINAREVERFREYAKAKGNRPATINYKTSTLQSMLKDAHLHGHLDTLPAFPQRLRMNNQKDRVLSAIELDTFERVFRAFGKEEEADLLIFLAETGCRFSEAAAMVPVHVDLGRGEWLIPKSKNGHKRTVLLTSKAQQALEGRLQGRRVWSINYRVFKHQWDRCKGAMGLADDLALTPHCLRHTCLSRLAQAGLSLPELQAWGGHRSLQALTRYLHLDTSGLQRAKAVLEG